MANDTQTLPVHGGQVRPTISDLQPTEDWSLVGVRRVERLADGGRNEDAAEVQLAQAAK